MNEDILKYLITCGLLEMQKCTERAECVQDYTESQLYEATELLSRWPIEPNRRLTEQERDMLGRGMVFILDKMYSEISVRDVVRLLSLSSPTAVSLSEPYLSAHLFLSYGAMLHADLRAQLSEEKVSNKHNRGDTNE